MRPPVKDENRKTRYPILYLLHGVGDNEVTWTEFGRANLILDNLIASKKAAPMIVVVRLKTEKRRTGSLEIRAIPGHEISP